MITIDWVVPAVQAVTIAALAAAAVTGVLLALTRRRPQQPERRPGHGRKH